MTQRLFWAYEQLYGGRELHMFKSLEARNAWVNAHSGVAKNQIKHRDFPEASDFDNVNIFIVHGDDGSQATRMVF